MTVKVNHIAGVCFQCKKSTINSPIPVVDIGQQSIHLPCLLLNQGQNIASQDRRILELERLVLALAKDSSFEIGNAGVEAAKYFPVPKDNAEGHAFDKAVQSLYERLDARGYK